jgi:transposase InsO family protein
MVASSDNYSFTCGSGIRSNKLAVNVGGVDIDVIVDSGSDCNIVGRGLWTRLKSRQIKCESRKTDRVIYPYATKEPLKVLGHFDAITQSGPSQVRAEFVVVDYESDALLGRQTAEELGLLRVGHQVNSCTTSYDNMCSKYPELFEGVGLLKNHQVKLSIDTAIKPVIQSRRGTPFGLREKVDKKLQELIDFDIIEPVPTNEPSEWVSPTVIVPKPNGDIRLCIDMRRANEAIRRERHPIPTVDEMLLDMNNSVVFSKLDLKWGYHQLLLSEESRNITTFSTHTGLFRYKRLMFGINSAPEIYQNEVRKIVQGIAGVANMSDDLIVHAASRADHDKKLEVVLQRLSGAGLTLNKDKCVFGVGEVEFLGHKLSCNGIEPGAGKVEAVVNAQPPKDVSEVRSFLGLVNYLCRFIPNLADISEPLRRLTKKDAVFTFGKDQLDSFNKLKEVLSNHTTLGFFDVDAVTKVIADASPIGMGAILIQMQEGVPRVISYANRSLSDVERRYSQTEKEGLALVWACERFKSYLLGIKFELLTDHKPLLSIYGKHSKPCARIERWVLRLQEFDFEIVYIKGKQNIADPLSRLLDPTRFSKSNISKADLEENASVRLVAINATPSALTTKQIEVESASDSELGKVRACVQYGNWSNFDGPKLYVAIQHELCVIGQVVLRGNRLVIPINMRSKVIALAHEGHLGIVGTKQNLRSKVWWPGMEKAAEVFCKSCHGCQITSKDPSPEPIRSTKLPSGPWQDIAADYLGPLPNGDYILVVIDYFSRFYEIKFTKSTKSEATLKAPESIFYTHGLPLSIKTDNGTTFTSDLFKSYMAHQGVDHYKVTPRWPQANGEVERQNASLMKRVKIAFSEHRDYKAELRRYVTAYRSLPHPSTGKTPAELLYGRVIRTKIPVLNTDYADQSVFDSDSQVKGNSKLYTDEHRGAKHSDIQPGDTVLMKNERPSKVDTRFLPTPVTVVDKRGSNVTVECGDGRQYDRNVSCFKPYLPQNVYVPESELADVQATPSTAPDVDVRSDDILPALDHTTTPRRSERTRSFPTKYKDYVTG